MYKIKRIKERLFYSLFLLGCMITFIFIGIFYEASTNSNKKKAYQYVDLYSQKVKDKLQLYIDQTNLIESYLIASNYELSEKKFLEIAKLLVDDDKILQGVQYLPNGIVSYVYPYEENKYSIGDDVLNVIDRKKDALHAKENNEIVISAPAELRQGGKGIIIRNPVYNDQQEFVGFVAVTLKLHEFLEATNLDMFKQQDYEYSLSADDYGYKKIISQYAHNDNLENAIDGKIEIGDNIWHLSVNPKNGFVCYGLVLLYLILGINLSYFISLAVANIFQRKDILQMMKNDDKVLRLALSIARLEVFHYNFNNKVLTFKLNGRKKQDLSKQVQNVPESLANTIVYPQSRQAFFRMYQEIASGAEQSTSVIKVYHDDEDYAWERVTLVNLSYDKGTLDNIVGVIDDITEEKESEENFVKEKKMRDVMKGDCEIYIEANISENKVLVVNEVVYSSNISLYDSYDTFLETYIRENIYVDDMDKLRENFNRKSLEDKYFHEGIDTFTLEYRCFDMGMYRWEIANVYLTNIKDNLHVMIVAHDNQINKEKELMLRYQAETDPLTGLYNRSTLEQRIKKYLENSFKQYAMFIIDLDHFKEINDTMGHLQGDYVLKDVAQILSQNFSTKDDIGRLGGDEFVVLKRNVVSLEEIEETAKRLNEQLRMTYEKDEHVIQISASIGICIGNKATSFQRLYSKTDEVLYEVKDHGKDNYKIVNLDEK